MKHNPISKIKQLYNDIIATIFPNCCVNCQSILYSDEIGVCPECMMDFTSVQTEGKHCCTICGGTFKVDNKVNLCIDCLTYPKLFDKNISLYEYNELAKKIIIEGKFKGHFGNYGRREFWSFLGHLLLERLKTKNLMLTKYDYVLSVPLSARRMVKRMFNQSNILASFIQKEFNVPVLEDTLIRKIDRQPQSNLTVEERRHNIVGCFEVVDAKKVVDKNLILIDDIYTTGSTVNECSKELKNAGCENILVITLFKPKLLAEVSIEKHFV